MHFLFFMICDDELVVISQGIIFITGVVFCYSLRNVLDNRFLCR